MQRSLRLLSVLVLVAVLTACGGNSVSPNPTKTRETEEQPARTTAPATDGAATTLPGTRASAAAAPTTVAPTVAPPESTTAPSDSTTAPASRATAARGNTNQATLTIMSHDSFNLSSAVVTQFEQANNVKLQFLKAGDTGAALNRAILSKNNPLADIFFGIDNTFFSRAIEADIFESYAPAGLDGIAADLQLDPEHRLIPIDYGFVNLNYDLAAFGPDKLALPQSLRDLTKPEYKGKLVVQNPATSSPGLAFLLATIATFGETGDYTWINFWQDLKRNEVEIASGWETAYYTNFSGSSGKGPQPIVVSYATSPAAEVAFSEGKLTTPPTGNLLPAKGAFRQIEFAGILKGTKQPELARKWMDYLLSPAVQNDVMAQMVVYPAVNKAAIPDVYRQFAPVPAEPAVIDPVQIAQNRERWLEEWSAAVGQ